MSIKSAASTITLTNCPLTMNEPCAQYSVKTAFEQHQFRQNGIALCKQIISLSIEIQKHRGCTLAILSGDHFFETQLFSIQRDITDKLQCFEALRREFLQLDETKHIMQEWICIRRLWRKDSVQENFLLHSNLITELLKLVWLVVQRAKLLSISPPQDSLVTFCMRDWLYMIETTAQARGLATHLAVSKESSGDIRSRIRYLHHQMKRFDDEFDIKLALFDVEHKQIITSAKGRSAYDTHFTTFASELESNFCLAEKPETDADTIYTMGSQVVSSCQYILTAGMKQIEKTLSPELQAWVQGNT